VQLRPGQHTGTLAEIIIPKEVFRPIMASERGPQLPPVSVAAGTPGNGAGRPNDLFTPQPRPSEPSLFEVPAQQWATQELSTVPSAEPGYLAATGAQPAVGYQPPAYPPPPAHATPPGPGMWPPLPEPAVPAVLAAAEDDAMELPIFQSVNGWFRTTETPAGLDTGVEPLNWESSADAGWQAAAQAATPDVTATTSSGLPVRAAGRHLVPGAAEPVQRPGTPIQSATPKRDPSRVAAAMSAYARGVANRRPQS
jgi:hypothetical protein